MRFMFNNPFGENFFWIEVPLKSAIGLAAILAIVGVWFFAFWLRRRRE